MKEFETIHGQKFLVDDEDFEEVSKQAWTIQNDKVISTRNVNLSRWLLGVPRRKKGSIEHLNGNKLDNRRVNLKFTALIAKRKKVKKKYASPVVEKIAYDGFEMVYSITMMSEFLGKSPAKILKVVQENDIRAMDVPPEMISALAPSTTKYDKIWFSVRGMKFIKDFFLEK